MNDPGRWVALALALALVLVAFLARPKARTVVWIAALASVALSALYIPAYLRGGPRIIDSTAYFLEARALAEGHLAWPISDPEAATAGRFLVRDTLGAGDHLAVIFPPGYPAVLALGFLVGAPLAVGPLLAGLLTLAVAALARELVRASELAERDGDAVVSAAALLSMASATLRYHTADTMSHGLAALCFTAAVLGAIRLTAADRAPHARATAPAGILLGFALGLLVATRPVSGVAGALAVAFVIGRALARRGDRRPLLLGLGAATVAAAGPLALLLLHQHAATGAWLRSAQSLYYASSDGPPGCFRYGFGAGIGCRLEHGPYVDAVLRGAYGARAALHTTGVRLWMHAGDALNVFALGPLTALAVAHAAGVRSRRILAVGPVLVVALYAPFYFDGSYPGAGARFYVDALPLELVAIAFSLVAIARRASPAWIERAPFLLGAASLLGFAARGADEHALLRDRDGGAPMLDAPFIERELAARGPHAARAVVFVPTDHGFNLAFDPDRRGSHDVARVRGDALDRLTMQALGARDAFVYEHGFDGAAPRLVPYAPRTDAPIEVEALYPPVTQQRGWAFTREAADASSGRELGVALESGEARVTLSLPSALAGRRLTPVARGAGHLTVVASAGRPDERVVAEWWVGSGIDGIGGGTTGNEARCDAPLENTESHALPGELSGLLLVIDTNCPGFALDAIEVGG